MNDSALPPASPCVKICVVDPLSGFCIGCGRTIEEIALWPEMSGLERRRTLDSLPTRLVAQRARTSRGGRAGGRMRERRAPWA